MSLITYCIDSIKIFSSQQQDMKQKTGPSAPLLITVIKNYSASEDASRSAPES